MNKAIVIGAGLSGLAAGWRLARAGVSVRILEARAVAGGVIRGAGADGFHFDTGASETMLKSARMEKLFSDMGLATRIQEADRRASKRFIVRRGRALALPQSVFSAPFNQVLSLSGKLGLLTEWRVPRGTADDETVASFVTRRMGTDVLDYAFNPLVSGIYAGDPDTLSMRHAFPVFWDMERRYGSLVKGAFGLARERRKSGEKRYVKRLISFEGGMTSVPRILAAGLEKELVCGAKVTSIEKTATGWRVCWDRAGEGFSEDAEGLVIAVPAHEMASLPLAPELLARLSPLSSLPYSPVATVAIGCAREAVSHPLDGFGMLIPRRETRGVIGVLFVSSMFPGRAPGGHVAMLAFVGGMSAPEYAALPDMDIKALVKVEMSRLLGFRGVPVFEHVQRWPQAIPHFPVGWQGAIDAVAAVEKDCPGLAITGNYLGSPASGDTMLRASDAAERLVGSPA
ncbi:MAG TPA: protoporphyrinogen oxidase [Opitutales bacterium]|nr:protoporphyrinogen oxidase [Opitutales bacterium]